MNASEALAKEAVKAGKDLSGLSQNSLLVGCTSTTNTSASASKKEASPATNLFELAKTHQALMSEKAAAAIKDNDIIYHAVVPDTSSLVPIEKLNMTKTMKLTELIPTLPSTVGADPFKNLVPLHVHEKSSVYSEQKDQLVRTETAAVADADGEMQARLQSLGFPSILDKFKMTLKMRQTGGHAGLVDVPKEVLEWSEFVVEEEEDMAVSSLISNVEGLRNGITSGLDRAMAILDAEQRDYDEMKVCFKLIIKKQADFILVINLV